MLALVLIALLPTALAEPTPVTGAFGSGRVEHLGDQRATFAGGAGARYQLQHVSTAGDYMYVEGEASAHHGTATAAAVKVRTERGFTTNPRGTGLALVGNVETLDIDYTKNHREPGPGLLRTSVIAAGGTIGAMHGGELHRLLTGIRAQFGLSGELDPRLSLSMLLRVEKRLANLPVHGIGELEAGVARVGRAQERFVRGSANMNLDGAYVGISVSGRQTRPDTGEADQKLDTRALLQAGKAF